MTLSDAFAHTRRWWPECLLDEISPAGRASPQEWLSPDENGVTTLWWNDEKTNKAGTLEPGEDVAFHWSETRGSVEITILPDGMWKVDDQRDPLTADLFVTESASPPAPVPPPMAAIAASNWFAAEGDWETAMDTMDEFAAEWARNEPVVDPEGERLTVDMAYWSDRILFTVSADGKSLEPRP